MKRMVPRLCTVLLLAVGAPWLGQAQPMGDPYADRVVSFTPGNPANPDFGHADAVLGAPDFNESMLSGLLSLGVGGSVTVEFVNNVAVGGAGADIEILGDPYDDEQWIAEVSADGVTYESFGQVRERVTLDLGAVGLEIARFVRLTDDGDPSGGRSPGAELDAVVALNSAAPPASAPTAAAPVATAPAAEASLTWVRTGGPLGGLGYDVRMRPDNPDRMYVTDAFAGVHISADGGLTWTPSNQGIVTRAGESGDGIPVFSLTIDANNPDIIWAGTQFQRGIFKSTDGGQTWTKMDNGVVEREGITFRGFTVDPHNSEVVYAAAEISSWAWAGQPRPGREFDMTRGVVYKTTNGGQSWKAVWRGDNLARYVWINPYDTNILYISTGFFDREAANSDPIAGTPGGEGILKSTDGGQTWRPVNNGLGNLYFSSLFMHPTNPEILLAAAGNIQYRGGGGVYLTTAGGETWTRTLAGESQDIFESVEISTSNPNIAYAGNDRAIYRSGDGGYTWQWVSGGEYWGPPGVRAGFPVDFQVDPRDPNRIFANEYGGGNFLSTDGGRTWTDASKGYTGAQVRDIAVDPTAPGRVFVAARSGIFVSSDGGSEWVGLNYSPVVAMEWNVVAIDPRDPQHILGATNWSGLFSSRDGGQAWELVAPRPTNRIGWRAVAFAPSDSSVVYAGSAGFYSAGSFDPAVAGQGIYVSRDGGLTWTPANNALSANAHVTALAVDPGDPQVVYAATTNHGLLRTMDGGQNWATVGGGLFASAQTLSVAINPADSHIVFTGLIRGAIYRSTDGGQTWKRSASGLNPEASVSDILFDPTNPQVIYAADLHSGVYRSVDGGGTWQAISAGLRTRAVNALAISSDGQHLYAATEGEGVYRLDLNGQPLPLAPAAQPEPATPLPTEPTKVPEEASTEPAGPVETPTAPVGLPCLGGAALLPLALFGLVLIFARRR